MKREKIMMKSLMMILLLMPSLANAQYISCSNVKISKIAVQGDRDDGFMFKNKMIINLRDTSDQAFNCGGKEYIHLENTHPAYSSLLSTALTAFASKQLVNISVNTSSATSISNQLSVISIHE